MSEFSVHLAVDLCSIWGYPQIHISSRPSNMILVAGQLEKEKKNRRNRQVWRSPYKTDSRRCLC